MPTLLKTLEEVTKCLADNADKLIVIDFYADWCGPCKMIAPKIEAMEKEFTNVVFVKVNVDENSDAAEQFEISAMPTFLFFKNSTQVDSVTGANEAKIREKVTSHR